MNHMSESEIRDNLNRRDRWVALTTMGADGFPHTVPLGYFFSGDLIVMGCRDGTQKVKNIERDSRVSVMWENGRGESAIRGVLFQGHARIVRDDVKRLALKREACAQRGETAPENVSPGTIYIEMRPEKTISWDSSPTTAAR